MPRLLSLLLLLPTIVSGQDIVTAFREDFENVDAWSQNNPRTPPEFSSDGKLLTLTDPPGGEVTWGTSIYHTPIEVNLNRTPWLVVKVPAMTGRFQMTLVNNETKDKKGGLAGLNEPGLAVCNIPEATGWSGKVTISMGLYVQGTEKMIQVDWLKIVSALTSEEKAAAPRRYALRNPQPNHGLTALAQRHAARPLDHFTRDGVGLSERVIYTDTATGNEVWRMTLDPGVDKVSYYDLEQLNADGSMLAFVTHRGETPVWVMNSDGSDLRPLVDDPALAGKGYFDGFWSSQDPHRWWVGQHDETGSRVLAYDVVTGETKLVAETKRPNLRLYPPHPDDEHFLLALNAGRDRPDCEVVVLDTKGGEQVVPIGGRFHRLRFTKGPDHRIFYNRDDPRTQWVIMPDGSDRRELPDPGSHPDWTYDGEELTYFNVGGIYGVNLHAQRRRIFETGSGGHGGPSRNGRFFIADSFGGTFGLSLVYARMDGAGVMQQLAYHGSAPMSHDPWTRAHPDHHSTHPHPSLSPDGTKAVYSTYDGQAYTDVEMAVCRYPDPPRELRATRRGNTVELQWREPSQHRELAGYAVYRSSISGEGYRQVNPKLVAGTSYTDAAPGDGPVYYVVAGVEQSGLTSPPTAEVCDREPWAGAYRRYIEAESGAWKLPVRDWLDEAQQSNGLAIGLGDDGPGTLRIPLDVPQAGSATLWLRCRGEGKLTVAGLGELDAPMGWHWLRAGTLQTVPKSLEVTFTDEVVRLDKILLTDDPAYRPIGQRRLAAATPDAPGQPTAKALDPFCVEVDWPVVTDPSVQYYQVYAVHAPDAYGTQATRVGSPAKPPFVDWGRTPGSASHYRITAVDRFGHESVESPAAMVTMPAQQIVTIELQPSDAKLGSGLKLVESGVDGVGQVAEAQPEANGSGTFLDWTVELPVEGDYYVWSQHWRPGDQNTPGRVVWDVDGDAVRDSYVIYGKFGQYSWWPASQHPTSTPTAYHRTAGAVDFRFGVGKGEIRLGRVVVTNDPTFMPDKFEDPPISHLTPQEQPVMIEPHGQELYRATFENLDDWYHEGAGELKLEAPGTMRLDILGSKQGGAGSMAFCRQDFPDQIALEYDLKVLSPNGLVITFVAMQGLHGEDLITGGLPARTGIFADYVGKDAALQSYHVSVSRYNDKGEHTGVSNWRRNPGLHLMAQGPDLCREIERWYKVRIVKDGPHLQLQVNGQLAHEFTDPNELETPLPTAGKIGFRAIGSDVRALVRNLRVVALR